jgi:predicted phosphodiesterase
MATVYDWMTRTLAECGSYEELKKHFNDYKKYVGNPTTTYVSFLARIREHRRNEEQEVPFTEEESEELVIKLTSGKQKSMDRARLASKISRDNFRAVNALEEYTKSLIECLDQFDISKFTKDHKIKDNKYSMIVSLSDLHFGEIVDLPENTYNYEVAGKRLALYAENIKKYASLYGIKKIILVGLGDIVNADSKFDKLLENAENRAAISIQATYLLEQFIVDLNKNFNIEIEWVVGNEGRIGNDFYTGMPQTESLITNSFDYVVYQMLKMIFRNAKGIVFNTGSFKERLIMLFNQNFLCIHGENIKNVDTDLTKIKGQWIDRQTRVDFFLFGHIHQIKISDTYARSGSLVGHNPYAHNNLYMGKASQVIVIVGDNNFRQPIGINLQDVSLVTHGYSVMPTEEYNSLS